MPSVGDDAERAEPRAAAVEDRGQFLTKLNTGSPAEPAFPP